MTKGPEFLRAFFLVSERQQIRALNELSTTEAEVQRFAGTKIWVMLEKNSRIIASFSSTIDQLRLLGT
jgi:hypothetical protein